MASISPSGFLVRSHLGLNSWRGHCVCWCAIFSEGFDRPCGFAYNCGLGTVRMALATQALSCPQQCVGAPSTSCQDRIACATGLRLSRRSFTTSQTVVKVNYVSRMGASKWTAAASASSEFQSTFTAKELERDAAKEALLLAVSSSHSSDFSFAQSGPGLFRCLSLS